MKKSALILGILMLLPGVFLVVNSFGITETYETKTEWASKQINPNETKVIASFYQESGYVTIDFDILILGSNFSGGEYVTIQISGPGNILRTWNHYWYHLDTFVQEQIQSGAFTIVVTSHLTSQVEAIVIYDRPIKIAYPVTQMKQQMILYFGIYFTIIGVVGIAVSLVPTKIDSARTPK